MIRLFTPIRLALLAGLVAVFIAGLLLVPAGASLPVHWGPSGVADGFLPREAALAMPLVIVALLLVVIAVASRLAGPRNVAAGAYGLGATLTGLMALMLAIAIVTVLIGAGFAVDMVQVMGVALGLLLIVLGNALPKTQPNSLAGIRIASTLRDAANWQATNRLAGILFMAGGLLLLVAALLVPAPQLIWWLAAAVLGPVLVSSAYSLAYARRAR